jgi:sporulation protein YlmC with PRC-barrel domain
MATSIDTTETTSLISSDKVDGTAVYGSDGEKIGSVEHLMIDKISGKVAYAVLTFGGFMGFGEDFYPIPWSTLEYDTNLGGYRLDVTKEQFGKLSANRSGSKTVDAGMGASMRSIERLLRAGSVSSRRLLKLS